MKKVLWTFILISLFKIDVNATESLNYSELSDVTPSATTVITEKRYQYYKLEKEYGPYASIDEENEYEFFDKEDYILGPKSSFMLDKPNSENHVITSQPGAYYKRVSAIKYLKFTLNSSDNEFTSFKLYDGNKQLKIFDMSQTNASLDHMNGVGYIRKNGVIKIEFHELHYLDDLTLEFSLKDKSNIDYMIETGDSQVYTLDNYNKTDKIIFKNSTLVNPKYEYFYDVLKDTSNVLKVVKPVTLYYTEEKLYHYYNLQKIYNDKYTVEPDGEFIYKDENKFKLFYTYLDTNLVKEKQEELKLPDNPEEKKATDMNVLTMPLYLNGNKVNKDTSLKENSYEKPLIKEDNLLTISKPKTIDSGNNLFYSIYFLIFFILSILILVLSKCYKKRLKCARV